MRGRETSLCSLSQSYGQHANLRKAEESPGRMIRENLIAERIAIDTYREIVRYLGEKDVTTRRMFEEILAVEEEHADDMADLLEGRE